MSVRPRLTTAAALAGVSALMLGLSACGGSDAVDPAATSGSTATNSDGSSVTIPDATFSQDLQDELPADIIEAGEINTAGIIFPPYASYQSDGKTVEGINVDLAAAFEQVLGVTVNYEALASTTDVYSGLASGRYDLGINPYSDTAETEESYDFVDWLHEYVSFAVAKGNPKSITSLDTACGTTIATLQGGSAAKVLESASEDCESAGKDAITIKTFPDQSTAILSVQSGRTDGAFSSQVPLTYYVEKSDGALELAGANQDNGFPNLLIGVFAPKDDELPTVMLDVFNQLEEDGVYDAILAKYGLEDNKIDEFGINLGGQD